MPQSRDGFTVVNEQLRVAISRRAALKTFAWSGAGFAALQAMPFGTVPLVYAQQPRRGGTIKLVHLTNRTSRLLNITKLASVFEVYEREDQALQSFGVTV